MKPSHVAKSLVVKIGHYYAAPIRQLIRHGCEAGQSNWKQTSSLSVCIGYMDRIRDRLCEHFLVGFKQY